MGRAFPRGAHVAIGYAVFVELAEYLCCNGDHDESYLVVTPDSIVDRAIVSGQIGCPVCRDEYSIVNGAADFRPTETERPPDPPPLLPATPPEVIHALVGLTGPGGYAVLVGSASTYASSLGDAMDGVGFVAVNPPNDVEVPPSASVLLGTTRIPLRSSMARAVVVGAEMATPQWLAEAVRVLLRGRRLVVLADTVEISGVQRLAADSGVWVGEKE